MDSKKEKKDSFLVAYKNTINDLDLRDFKEIDLDYLVWLCGKMRDQKDNSVTVSWSEIRTVTLKHNDKQAALKDILTMNDKLAMSFRIYVGKDGKIYQGSMFSFVTDPKKETVAISVNQGFLDLLNDYGIGGYTRFEWAEYVSLRGKYSKALYRLIRQYNNNDKKTGVSSFTLDMDGIRSKMGIPQSCPNYRIFTKFVAPSVKALEGFFPDLHCEAQYGTGTGRPLKGFRFSWKKVIEVKATEAVTQPQRALQKPQSKSKNRFNNFSQRVYSADEMNALESALLKADSGEE